jgi:hypothetical protein
MLPVCAILVATLLAGLIAGTSAPAFVAAALGASAATWFLTLRNAPRLTCFAILDPQQPDGEILLHAFREASDEALRRRRAVGLRIAALSGASSARFRLGLDRSGDLEVCRDGARPLALKRPGSWIADHPLPLELPRTRCLCLTLTPAGARRVRVARTVASACPRGAWLAAASVAAAACLLDTGWLLAAALGFALQAYLLNHGPHGADEQPRIEPR